MAVLSAPRAIRGSQSESYGWRAEHKRGRSLSFLKLLPSLNLKERGDFIENR